LQIDNENIINLKTYLRELQAVTTELCEAHDLLGQAKQDVAVKDSDVKRLQQKKSTIEEAIRIEKKIFDTLPR